MEHQPIVLINDVPALLLPTEVMEKLGLKVGDELEIAVENRPLILRPWDRVERERKMDAAMQEIMERHHLVFERLAEGAP